MVRIIPTLTLSEGSVVERYMKENTPVKVARYLEQLGFTKIHLIDADAVAVQKPANLKTVEQIVKTTRLKVQYGGWFPTLQTMEEAFSHGAEQIVLTCSNAFEKDLWKKALKKFSAQRIMLSLDVDKTYIRGCDPLAMTPWKNIVALLQKEGLKFLLIKYFDPSNESCGLTHKNFYADFKKRFPTLHLTACCSIERIEDLKILKEVGIEEVQIDATFQIEQFHRRFIAQQQDS